VSDLLGINRLHDFLVQLGLGAKTGIDIGDELSGLVPSPAWKQKRFKKKALQVWFPGETVIAGIGQGYMLVTPLQLAHVAATIANRGHRFAPRLVTRVRDSRTGRMIDLPPRPLPDVAVRDPKFWDVIINGMIGVTNEGGGTARAAQAGAPYRMAGKTGTAQVFSIGQNEKYNESQVEDRLRDHGLFISFAPAEAPKLAVAVVVENGKHGSVAAQITRKVFDAYLLPPGQSQAGAEAAQPPPGGADE
jgi:penicillin-binding protein 2